MKKSNFKKVFCIIAITLFTTNCFSQNGLWFSGSGNDTTKTNRFVLINNSEVVNGKISAKNVSVSNTLTADSIYVRSINVNNSNMIGNMKSDSLTVTGGAHILGSLKIGTHSLQLGPITPSGPPNQITTDGNTITLGKSPGNYFDIQIGIGKQLPLSGMMLDVEGNINLPQLNGYHINGNEVLQYHGSSPTPVISNIFVGVTAGMSTTTGHDNAFLGFEAGYDNTEGISNTALGSGALRYNTIENNNTAIVL